MKLFFIKKKTLLLSASIIAIFILVLLGFYFLM